MSTAVVRHALIAAIRWWGSYTQPGNEAGGPGRSGQKIVLWQLGAVR